jgi:hypothetical protein
MAELPGAVGRGTFGDGARCIAMPRPLRHQRDEGLDVPRVELQSVRRESAVHHLAGVRQVLGIRRSTLGVRLAALPYRGLRVAKQLGRLIE